MASGEPTLRDAQQTSDRVKMVLADRFAITNVTLELENPPPPEVTARASTGSAVLP